MLKPKPKEVRFTYRTGPDRASRIKQQANAAGLTYEAFFDVAVDAYLAKGLRPRGCYPRTKLEARGCETLLGYLRVKNKHGRVIRGILLAALGLAG